MNKFKICFWLNVPSNHQTIFLQDLNLHKNINLQVRYFSTQSQERLEIGWRDEKSLYGYEMYVDSVDDALKVTKDWKDRIHIITGYNCAFNKELLPLLIKNDIQWIHWSERFGVNLARKLNFSVFLFKLFRPPFLLLFKKYYGGLVNKYALGCFAQGELARRDFKLMGIKDLKIDYLFYTTKALTRTNKPPLILTNSPNKHNFLFCGTLYKRKGIEDILHAFAQLTNAEDWGLVLVGQDTSNGYYEKLALELGIENKVLFTGVIKADQVIPFYSHCDVYLLPSRFDGWGAVINEAASIGMPLISSTQTGAAFHLIKNEKNGYIVNAEKKNELIKAMQQYVSNSDLIQQHGAFSKKLYQDYKPEKNVDRFIASIEKWSNND